MQTLAVKHESIQQRAMLRTGAVVLATAFVAVCAHIAIPLPFSPVPLTLQTFAVILIGLLFGARMGALTLALYLAEGVCGMPVFAPGIGGMAQLMGPTGGYLLAYPLAAGCAGYVARDLALAMPRMAANIIGGIAATIITMSMGAAWLYALTHASLAHIAMAAVLPFLPGEAVKIVAAAGIAAGFFKLRQHKA